MICLFFRFGQILKFLHLLIARSPKNPMETLATPDGRRQFQGDTQGALLVQQHADHQVEAEHCFHYALDIACNQQAKSFELRAATSLARLWQQQGKRQDGHDLLAPVYGWFTEGFDTADLEDAKALLEALA